MLIVDEAARIDDALYFSLRPMLAVSGGALMMMSTPYGKRGVFYEAWTGDPGLWERYEVPATEVPRISPEFLEEKRRALGSRWFEQEYCAGFGELEGAVFSREVVEQMFDTLYALLWDPSEAELVE